MFAGTYVCVRTRADGVVVVLGFALVESIRLRAPLDTKNFMNAFVARTRQRTSRGMLRGTETSKLVTIADKRQGAE